MTTMAFHHVARISWRTSTRLRPQRPAPTLGTVAFFSSTSSSSSSSSNNNNNNNNNKFERDFIQKQKITSADTASKATSDTTNSDNDNSDPQRRHNDHQARMFDEMATFFSSHEAVPEKVVPILRDMSNRMLTRALERRAQGHAQDQASRPARANRTCHENALHILDVGCGSGVLFDFFVQAAHAQGLTVHITGVDLSPNMVEQARLYANELLSNNNNNNKHSISVHVGDICNRDWTIPTSRSQSDEPQQQQPQLYDLVVANACFGNFWDRSLALEQMANALNLHGLLCITHPLGSEFVRQLHQEDPQTVPYLLPTTTDELQQLARTLPLRVLDIVDKSDSIDDSDNDGYYMATAVKVVYRTLPQTMRLRGRVDTGYGRGGKKLGFPTANLPSRLFQGALQDVPCGVYFGWALLEDNDDDTKKKGRNVLHKAVVNVGYSPTFEGQENPEKIVEAHLIFPEQSSSSSSSSSPLDPPDFYGEIMRLQLHGFIRPEMKFPSFPALIAQISTDVQDAKDALDWEFYQHFQKDLFLQSSTLSLSSAWIGSGGGDEDASWEYEDVESVLTRL